tara:strand:- start:187 stop:1116 length:930 start_codon:yes stop_codon:yes gene_type:complete
MNPVLFRLLLLVCLGVVTRACAAFSRAVKPSRKDVASNLQESILVIVSGSREHLVELLDHLVRNATHPDRVFVSVPRSLVQRMPHSLSRHVRTTHARAAHAEGFAYSLTVRAQTRLGKGWDVRCVAQVHTPALLSGVAFVLTSLPRVEPSQTFTCLTKRQRRVACRYLCRQIQTHTVVQNVFASHAFLFHGTALELSDTMSSVDGSDVLLSCALHARGIRFIIPECIMWSTNERVIPDRGAWSATFRADVLAFFDASADDPLPTRFVVGLTHGAGSLELTKKYGSVSAAHAKTRSAGCVQVEEIDGEIV